MNNEEHLKIDLSEKVLAVRQQEKEISHKVHFIQLEIVSSVQADAHYSIDKDANQIQGNISISSRLDSLDRYTKRIDIDDHRNSSLIIRFYAFGQLHTELILKMLPPPLLVKSALFKKGNEKVQANCMDVDSDKNFVISVDLTRPVMNGENAKLHYKHYYKEPGGNVFKESKNGSVNMESYDVRKAFTFYAPKNYSGSTLAISFYVKGEVEPDESKEQHSVRYYKIISAGGAKINAVYWSQDEKFTPIQKDGETVDYENSNVRNEICNNEDGYLHIHTQQMYGQRVKVCVVERDRTGEDAPVISREVLITDNKACVVFPMQELLPKLYSLRCAWLEGDNFDLVAIVKPVNENIPEKESVSPLYLEIDKRSYTPAKSTLAGTRKFVIGSAEDEKKEEENENVKKCFCGKEHIDLRDKMTFTKQTSGTNCKDTCDNIISPLGIKSESSTVKLSNGKYGAFYQIAQENSLDTCLEYNGTLIQNSIEYLDLALDSLYPVVVGVNHTFGNTYNEGSTDHFVIIVKRFCKESNIYYQFWDVGSLKGGDVEYTFMLDSNKHLICNKTYSINKTYIVTQVRRNIDTSNGTIITLETLRK